MKDFKTVCKMEPQNRDAREKYEYTQREHKLKLLQAAIFVEDRKVEINVEDIPVESSYTGPRLEKIEECTPEFVRKLNEWQKD